MLVTVTMAIMIVAMIIVDRGCDGISKITRDGWDDNESDNDCIEDRDNDR